MSKTNGFRKTETGVISAFLPDDWQITGKPSDYEKCCQNIDNVVGAGEWIIANCEQCPMNKYLPVCPCFERLYPYHRQTVCSVCGHRIIGHEYSLAPS